MVKSVVHTRTKLFTAILLFISFFASAQVQFKAKSSRYEVGRNEQFQIQFELNSTGNGFKAPDLSNFQVLQGPMRSQSTQIINGRRSESLTFSYVLRAKKAGTYTIGSASVETGSGAVKSQPIKIKVLEKSQQKSDPNDPYAVAARNAFIKVSPSKYSVYQGEPLTVSYKLFFTQGIGIGRFMVEKQPSYKDFYKEDITIKSINTNQETYKGRTYNMGVIEQKVIIPQRSGKLSPGNLEVQIPTSIPTNKRDRFWGTVITQTINQTSIAEFPTITVKPLPSSGKPSHFSGAVGQYKFEVRASKTELTTDESLSIKVSLEGTGNIKLVDAPTPEIPKSFEVYDPEYKEKIRVTSSGMSGYKTWEYLLIPRYGGTYKIPAMHWSYFDPRTKRYKTVSSEEMVITVTGDANENAKGQGMIASETEKVNFIGKDILFIKTKSEGFTPVNKTFLGSSLYYTLLSIAGILFAGITSFFFLVTRRQKDYGKIRSQKASKMANKHLAEAKKELEQNNRGAFYLALSTALTGYLADKFNIPNSQFSKDHIEETLLKQGVSETIITEVLERLDKSEMARFIGASENSLQQDYEETAELIKQIEEEL